MTEPGLKNHAQDYPGGATSPVGRFACHRTEHLAFEAEFNLERTRTEAQASNEDLRSLFYYAGYRYDF